MMDLKRFGLYIAIFGVIFILWMKWIEQTDQRRQFAAQERVSQIATTGDFVPAAPAIEQALEEAQADLVTLPGNQADINKDRLIHVTTDVLDLSIDSLGGGIVDAKLLAYQTALDEKNDPYVLFNSLPATRYIAQTGFVSSEYPQAGPIQFSAEKARYALSDDENTLTVMLTGEDDSGVTVTKNYTFEKGSYLVKLDYLVDNRTQTPWAGSLYNQLVRIEPKTASAGLFVLPAYIGASISNPEGKLYQKVRFKDMRKQSLNEVITGGWVAMQEHYFLSAWVPDAQQTSRYYSHYNANTSEYTIGYVGPRQEVAPGEQLSMHAEMYVGPEIAENLKPIAPGLELTIDYGWLWFISVFLFWLMKAIYQIVGNWGWSIIVVTILIKLVFYHLSAKSYRSMAGMRKLQPKLQQLKERYADDRAKMGQATMELYRREKINPLGGCLPILVQIPVFIALYWVLLESVELRHAPFILWIQDLSAKDPYYILPILMGMSMFVMQKLNPPPPDPMMAKMMLLMPVVFTFIFLQFPSGLVLYWVVNNLLSIAQQWYITRKVEKEGAIAPYRKKRKK